MNYTPEMKAMVKTAIDHRGWTKAEFMRRSGLPQQTARRIYDGITTSIDEENAARMCKALQLPLDQFWQMSVRDLKEAYQLDTIESQALKEASVQYGFSVEALQTAQRYEVLSQQSRKKLIGILELLEQTENKA